MTKYKLMHCSKYEQVFVIFQCQSDTILLLEDYFFLEKIHSRGMQVSSNKHL